MRLLTAAAVLRADLAASCLRGALPVTHIEDTVASTNSTMTLTTS